MTTRYARKFLAKHFPGAEIETYRIKDGSWHATLRHGSNTANFSTRNAWSHFSRAGAIRELAKAEIYRRRSAIDSVKIEILP